MGKRISFVILACAAIAAIAWGAFHFRAARRSRNNQPALISAANQTLSWAEAVEKVKADRGEAAGGAIEIPAELKPYTDRHWFLATQVAEVDKYKVQTCRDFLDLAAMIGRGELVTVPAVTDSYVLFGVGQKADDEGTIVDFGTGRFCAGQTAMGVSDPR